MNTNCEICGEPMPAGEEMFKFHGYSGPCPSPPLAETATPTERESTRLTVSERDELGQVVRNAWVRWAGEQPSPKPSWLVPWNQLPEIDREADRCIADELVAYLRLPGLAFKVVDGMPTGTGVGVIWMEHCIEIVGNIEAMRQSEGNSVTILCDNPEADTRNQQSAVEVSGDFSDWQQQRYYAESWDKALEAAANAARAYYAREDSDAPSK